MLNASLWGFSLFFLVRVCVCVLPYHSRASVCLCVHLDVCVCVHPSTGSSCRRLELPCTGLCWRGRTASRCRRRRFLQLPRSQETSVTPPAATRPVAPADVPANHQRGSASRTSRRKMRRCATWRGSAREGGRVRGPRVFLYPSLISLPMSMGGGTLIQELEQ